MSDFIHNLKKINLSSARLNESICNSNSSISNIKNSNNYIKGYKILNKESSFRAFLMGVLMLVATFISLYLALEERTWGKGILSFIVCWVISACVIDYGISPIISWIESMRPSVKFYKNLLVEIEHLEEKIRNSTASIQQKDYEFGVCVEQNVIPMVHQRGLISFKEVSQNILQNLVNEEFLKGLLQKEIGKGNLQKIKMTDGEDMYKSLINEPKIRKEYISFD